MEGEIQYVLSTLKLCTDAFTIKQFLLPLVHVHTCESLVANRI